MQVAPSRIYDTTPGTSPGLVALGFDPGMQPGITVVEKRDRAYRHLWSKVIRTDSSRPDGERFDEITDCLSWVIREFHPSLLVSEEQLTVQAAKQEEGDFNANNGKTMETVGIARAVARIFRVHFLEVRTQTARSTVIGKGAVKGTKKEKKRQVQVFVQRLLGVPRLALDTSEAGLNAIYGLHLSPSERRGA